MVSSPALSTGLLPADCATIGSFNVTATAAALAGLAGVLASICVLAFIMVLTGRSSFDTPRIGQAEDPGIDRILLSLFCATFGLAIAAVQYAILAGDASSAALDYGRAASEELTADISFTASLLTLLQGFTLLIGPRLFGTTNVTMRVVSSVIAPALSMFYVCTAAQDVSMGIWAGARGKTDPAGPVEVCGISGFSADVQRFGLALPTAMIITLTLLFWWLPTRHHQKPPPRPRLGGSALLAPMLGLTLTCTAAVTSGMFSIYDPQSRLTGTEVWIALGVTSAVFLIQAFMIRLPLPDVATVPEADQADLAVGHARATRAAGRWPRTAPIPSPTGWRLGPQHKAAPALAPRLADATHGRSAMPGKPRASAGDSFPAWAKDRLFSLRRQHDPAKWLERAKQHWLAREALGPEANEPPRQSPNPDQA
jgi:hypothetical protein